MSAMRSRVSAFLSVGAACAAVALATPREIVPLFPIRNGTTTNTLLTTPTDDSTSLSIPAIRPTGDSTCDSECSVVYPQLSGIQWIPETQIVYTTKITVATVSYFIITSANATLSTETRTVYDENIPARYDLYSLGTDDAGTAVLTFPVSQSGGVTYVSAITYPTPFLDYMPEYQWQGVFQTNDRDSQPACETEVRKPVVVELPKHPEYPQPKGPLSPGRFDQFGTGSKPIWAPVKDEPDALWFQVEFPSESAFFYCESTQPPYSAPTEYSAPLYITETTTVWATAIPSPSSPEGIIVIQPTASGWETTSEHLLTPHIPHTEVQESGFETETTGPQQSGITPNGGGTSPPVRIEVSVTGFDDVGPTKTPSSNQGPGQNQGPGEPSPGNQAQQSGNPDPGDNNTPSFPDAIISIINNNPGIFASKPYTPPNNIITPAPAAFPQGQFAAPTPVFTFVPTVINGQSTTIPVFIIPGSGATATIGQSVEINGQPTVLAAPPAFFTFIPTTVNGVATSTPAYIISGTSTASIGQTITLNGQPTVLAVPPTIFTMIPTTINGVETSVPAYIISGSITATIGQTVTVNGQATVLSAPAAVFTMITTTINGVATTIPGYIISGTSTATIGQTVVINGQTTVLTMPTPTGFVPSEFGGPVATSVQSGPQATSTRGKGTPGAASVGYSVSLNSVLVGLGIALMVWL